MATPDGLRAAAAQRIQPDRRLSLRSFATSTGYTNQRLGDQYVTLSVKVPAHMAADLTALAASYEWSVSALVRWYVADGLAHEQEHPE